MKTRLNRKGGFSVAEVIIALSIIVAVSVAAMVMVITSMSVKTTLVARSEGINFAENALECFKAADDEDFESLIEQVCEVEWNTPDDFDGVAKIFKKDKFTAKITVDFDSDRPTFNIVVTEKDDEDAEIISFSYTKGAK